MTSDSGCFYPYIELWGVILAVGHTPPILTLVCVYIYTPLFLCGLAELVLMYTAIIMQILTGANACMYLEDEIVVLTHLLHHTHCQLRSQMSPYKYTE